MRNIISIFLLALSVAVHAQEQVTFTKNLDSLIIKYISEHDLPSAGVGVIYQGSTLYGKRFSQVKDNNAYSTVEERSIYNIASVAKPMVATAKL